MGLNYRGRRKLGPLPVWRNVSRSEGNGTTRLLDGQALRRELEQPYEEEDRRPARWLLLHVGLTWLSY